MLQRTVELLVQNAATWLAAGALPFALGATIALAAAAVFSWVALSLRWWRGKLGVGLAVFLGLLAIPSAVGVGLACGSGPMSEAATRVIGAHRETLGIAAPVGLALLLPLVDAWTLDGQDDEAFFEIETKDQSIDLAAFTTESGRRRLGERVTLAHVRRRYEQHARDTMQAAVRGPFAPEIDARLDAELGALAADGYARLLPALRTDREGALPPPVASAQLAEAFFQVWAPERARLAAEDYRGWALLAAAGPWWLLAGVAALVGAVSSRRASR